MGLFSSNKNEEQPVSPLADSLGEPAIYLNGVGVNLYVYDKCIVIDRTKGGLFNLGNRTYKVIPLKYITAVQVKSTGATTGFIEFATYGHEFTAMKGFNRTDDENNISFGGGAEIAKSIVDFILPKII